MLGTDGAPVIFGRFFEIEETAEEINAMLGELKTGSVEHLALLAGAGIWIANLWQS